MVRIADLLVFLSVSTGYFEQNLYVSGPADIVNLPGKD